MLRCAAFVGVLSLSGASIGAGEARESVIVGVNVVDVRAGLVAAGMDVAWSEGTITRISPTGQVAIAEDARVIEGEGLFLIPGLWDAHVHFTSSPETFGPLLVAHGVTCARELGADTTTVLSLKERFSTPGEIGPELWVSGAIIDGSPPIWPFSEPVSTPEEGRAAVKKLADAGVDFIKVYSLLKPDVYRAIIEEAHGRGLKVTGHIPNSVSIDEAIAAGQNCNEHLQRFDAEILRITGAARGEGVWGDFVGWRAFGQLTPAQLDELAARIAKGRMWQCPTMVVMQGIAGIPDGVGERDPAMKYVPSALKAFWAGPGYVEFGRAIGDAPQAMRGVVGALHRAGVTLMVGSDLSNPYVFAGQSVHQEMVNFQEAGIPPIEVLRSATIHPATFVGAQGRHGSVEVGKAASMVLIEGDPTKSVRNIAKIRGVVLKGMYHDRGSIDGMLADVEQIASDEPAAAEGVAVELDLPGEVIDRGSFSMTFGNFDAGTEHFLITRSDDGVRMMSRVDPKGGFQKPYVSTLHVRADGTPVGATYRELTEGGVEATYEIEAKAIVQKASKNGERLAENEFPIPENMIFSAPMYASEIATHLLLKLGVGETRELNSVGFGFQGWQLAATPMTIERLPDEPYARADGSTTPARRYRSVVTTPMGAFEVQNWTSDAGLLWKSTVKMPFGSMTIERK